MPAAERAETTVWTDGACLGNPGRGGWAWAESHELYESGYAAATTNQRMELTAVLQAVTSFPGRLTIVSDSTYVVNCFRDRWWEGWRRRGWLNSAKKPVANQDIWAPLVEAVIDERPGEIRFRWVKGHANDEMNNFVDLLATTAARAGLGQAGPATSPRVGGVRTGSHPPEGPQQLF
jgi:ribonuclease HI